jgi:hypothetical protein
MPILGLGCSVVVPPALRCLPASAALLSLTRLPPVALQGICSEIMRDVGARKLIERMAAR